MEITNFRFFPAAPSSAYIHKQTAVQPSVLCIVSARFLLSYHILCGVNRLLTLFYNYYRYIFYHFHSISFKKFIFWNATIKFNVFVILFLLVFLFFFYSFYSSFSCSSCSVGYFIYIFFFASFGKTLTEGKVVTLVQIVNKFIQKRQQYNNIEFQFKKKWHRDDPHFIVIVLCFKYDQKKFGFALHPIRTTFLQRFSFMFPLSVYFIRFHVHYAGYIVLSHFVFTRTYFVV